MHILIVEDEQPALQAMEGMVRAAARHAVVKGLCQPQAAMEYAGEHTVDVAFLKLELPGMGGLPLARHLRMLNPYVNLVFLAAGKASKKNLAQLWELHASGLLVKPVSQQQVNREMQALRKMVNGRRVPKL